MASQCYITGRIDEAVRYSDAGQTGDRRNGDELPFGIEGLLGTAYINIGQPERWVEWCRSQLARGRDTHTITRECLVYALAIAGCGEEAMAAATASSSAAEATGNPCRALACPYRPTGLPSATPIPTARWTPLRRGLVIAQDSGNRYNESHSGERAVRSRSRTRRPAGRARLPRAGHPQFPRRGQHQRCSASPWPSSPPFSTGSDATNRRPPSPVSLSAPYRQRPSPNSTPPITHLRDVLGDQTYESLARKGETMTTAAMVDLRLRPNRPGPSRTERCLEIDDIRESRNSVSVSVWHGDMPDIVDQR